MARVKGGLFTGMLDINKRFPLDSRMLVSKREDLINPTTWKTNTLNTEATYNTMIVSVNSDGEHNGVYYLINRKEITLENYSAYQSALAAGEDVNTYFSMWMKLGTLEDIASVENKLREIIGDVPNGTTIVDMIANTTSASNLSPVDGTIIISTRDDQTQLIGVAIAPSENNSLVAVDGGLFVPEYMAGTGIDIVDHTISVKLADTTHGLVAINGALTLNLATYDSDGAMSKEDKRILDELKDTVSMLDDACSWGEM